MKGRKYLNRITIGIVKKTEKGFKLEILSGELLSDVPDPFNEREMQKIRKLIVPDRKSRVKEGELVEIIRITHDTKPEDPRRGVCFVETKPIPKEILENIPRKNKIVLPDIYQYSLPHGVFLEFYITCLSMDSFSGLLGPESKLREVFSKAYLKKEPEVESKELKIFLTRYHKLNEKEVDELLTTKVVNKKHIKLGIETITRIDKIEKNVLIGKGYNWQKEKLTEIADMYDGKFVIWHLINGEHHKWVGIVKTEEELTSIEKEYVKKRREEIKKEYKLHKQALELSKKVKKIKEEDLSEDDPYGGGYRDTYIIEDPQFEGKEYVYEYFDGDFDIPSRQTVDGRAVLIYIHGDKNIFNYALLKW